MAEPRSFVSCSPSPARCGSSRALLLVAAGAVLLAALWLLNTGSGTSDGVDFAANTAARPAGDDGALAEIDGAALAGVEAAEAGSRARAGGPGDFVRLRGRGLLVGTVLDREGGTGVAGAEVRLLPVPPVGVHVAAHIARLVGVGDEFSPRVKAVARTVSAPDGTFAFAGVREGRWYVHATAVHHLQDMPVLARTVESGSGGPVDVWMRGGGRILGTVFRPDGTPASGADVSLTTSSMRFLEAASNGEVAMLRTQTDAEGRFAFSAVAPAEGYEAAAIGDGFAITHLLGIDVVRGQDTEVAIHGAACATIRGRIVSGGALLGEGDEPVPLAGAKVAAMPRGLRHMKLAKEILVGTHATTAEDGTYELTSVSAGTVDILAMADGHLPARGPVVRVGSGGEQVAEDFELERGPMVRGRVIDESGAAVPGARVMWSVIDVLEIEGRPSLAPLFVAGMRDFAYPVSDADGRFVAGPFTASEARNGKFTVRVLMAGYESARVQWEPTAEKRSVDGLLNPERLDEIEVVLRRGGVLRGRVVDAATGAPVTRFSARVMNRIDSDPGEPSRLSPFAGDVLIEDEEGRFELDEIAAGPQTLTVEAEGFQLASLEVTVPRGEAPGDVTVELQRGATVRGFVVDTEGSGIAGAQVTTVARVRLEFDRLENGRLLIEDGLAVRNRGRQITPPTGFLRYAAALGLMGTSVVNTEPDGSFVLSGLEPGTQEVLAFHRNYRAGAELVEARVETALPEGAAGAASDAESSLLGAADAVRVVMTEGGGLRGVVSDRFGRPVEGATVIAMSPGLGADLRSIGLRGGGGSGPAPASAPARAGANGDIHQARTGADGVYEIRHMEGGAYFLLATRGDESLTVMSFLGTLNFQLVSVPRDRVITKNMVDTSAGACRVYGRVLAGGEPRGAGILLALNLDAEGFLGVDFKAAPVENDGSYAFEGLAPGEYQVTYEVRGTRSSFLMDVPDAPELQFDVALPEGSITGTLLDRESRDPIAGARLVLTPLDRIDEPGLLAQVFASETGVVRTRSGKDGVFRFEGLAEGEYRLTVERAQSGRGKSRTVYAPVEPLDVDVEEDESVDVGAIELVPGVAVTGRVIDDRGQPVAEARVLASRVEAVRGRARTATTDADGAFRVEGLGLGEWEFTPNAPGFATGVPRTVTLDEGATSDSTPPLELELVEGVVVTVVAIDEAGRPRPGVACALQRKGEASRRASVNPGEFFQRFFTGEATTDGQGQMELGRYAAGSYELRASLGGRVVKKPVVLDGTERSLDVEVTIEAK